MGSKKKNKEGMNRKSRTDLSSEAGRQMLCDLINYETTGFDPFLPETYETEEFWKSREAYQTISFAAFLDQVPRMASMAAAQMPVEQQEKAEQEAKKQNNESKKENVHRTNGNTKDPSNSQSKDNNQFQQHEAEKMVCDNKPQSLRDTIVGTHPNHEMAFVLFELWVTVIANMHSSLSFCKMVEKFVSTLKFQKNAKCSYSCWYKECKC